MVAIGFACMNAAFAGLFSVLLRMALRKVPDAEVATFVIAVMGATIALLAALVFGSSLDELRFGELWPFIIVGAAAPGVGQLLYVHGVRTAGASRPAIVVAVAPLLSALLAVVFLDESLGIALGVGTILIVAGGAAIGWEGARPAEFKRIGILLALVSAIFFSARDVIVRWASDETIASPQVGMATAFLTATVAVGAYLALTRGPRSAAAHVGSSFRPFLLAALVVSIGQVAIFEALARGPVTVVVPLVGTHALWAVLFSIVLLRKFEAISPRIVVAALLAVSGGILIGVFRDSGEATSRERPEPAAQSIYAPEACEQLAVGAASAAAVTVTRRDTSASECASNGSVSSDISAPSVPNTHQRTRHEMSSRGTPGSASTS